MWDRYCVPTSGPWRSSWVGSCTTEKQICKMSPYEELQRRELAQEVLVPIAELGQVVDEAPRELAPDHGGQLQRALGGVRQPVDAGRDHVRELGALLEAF